MFRKPAILTGLILALLCIAAGIYLCNMNYEEFIFSVTKFPGLGHKQDKLLDLINLQKFNTIKYTPFFLGGLIVVVSFLSDKILSLIRLAKNQFNYTIKEIGSIKRKYLIFASGLLIFSFVLRLYYVITMPMSHDEAWTYLNFTKPGFLYSVSFYPLPNNHILHTLLTNFSYFLPFSTTVDLRIPNLIINTLSVFILFISFAKLINEKIALILSVLYGSLFPVLYYGYCSRGYSLVLFAFILCFYATVGLIRKYEESKTGKYFVLLSAGCITGFYTMPSFLYPYAVLTSFLFAYFLVRKASKQLIMLIISGFVSALIILILYSPVILISGLKSIISNKFVEPVSRAEVYGKLYSHFSDTSQFLLSADLLIIAGLVFLISLFLLIWKKSNKIEVLLAVYSIFACPVILLIHSVIPYPRTWIYIIIPVLFLTGLLIEKLNLSKIGFVLLSAFILTISAFLILNFNREIYKYEEGSFVADDLADTIAGNSSDTIYCNHPFIRTDLAYRFEEKKLPVVIVNPLFAPIEKDSIFLKRKYDFLVTGSRMSETAGYKLIKTYDSGLYLYRNLKDQPVNK